MASNKDPQPAPVDEEEEPSHPDGGEQLPSSDMARRQRPQQPRPEVDLTMPYNEERSISTCHMASDDPQPSDGEEALHPDGRAQLPSSQMAGERPRQRPAMAANAARPEIDLNVPYTEEQSLSSHSSILRSVADHSGRSASHESAAEARQSKIRAAGNIGANMKSPESSAHQVQRLGPQHRQANIGQRTAEMQQTASSTPGAHSFEHTDHRQRQRPAMAANAARPEIDLNVPYTEEQSLSSHSSILRSVADHSGRSASHESAAEARQSKIRAAGNIGANMKSPESSAHQVQRLGPQHRQANIGQRTAEMQQTASSTPGAHSFEQTDHRQRQLNHPANQHAGVSQRQPDYFANQLAVINSNTPDFHNLDVQQYTGTNSGFHDLAVQQYTGTNSDFDVVERSFASPPSMQPQATAPFYSSRHAMLNSQHSASHDSAAQPRRPAENIEANMESSASRTVDNQLAGGTQLQLNYRPNQLAGGTQIQLNYPANQLPSVPPRDFDRSNTRGLNNPTSGFTRFDGAGRSFASSPSMQPRATFYSSPYDARPPVRAVDQYATSSAAQLPPVRAPPQFPPSSSNTRNWFMTHASSLAGPSSRPDSVPYYSQRASDSTTPGRQMGPNSLSELRERSRSGAISNALGEIAAERRNLPELPQLVENFDFIYERSSEPSPEIPQELLDLADSFLSEPPQ